MGLIHPKDLTERLLQGVIGMEESVTYQAIIQKGIAQGMAQGITQGMCQGRVEGERAGLLRIGAQKFGPPDSVTRSAIDAITDPTQLESLLDRLLGANSWQELLAPPS
jgi:hypothetical protein